MDNEQNNFVKMIELIKNNKESLDIFDEQSQT